MFCWQKRQIEGNAEEIQKVLRKKRLSLSSDKSKIMVFEKERGRMKKGRRRRDRGSKRNEIFGTYFAEEQRGKKAYKGKIKENNNSDEKDMEHRRKNIQRQLREKNEDVRIANKTCDSIRSRNIEMAI